MYSNGCRCERCRQAWAEYQRRRRAASKSPTSTAEGPAPGLPPDKDYDHGLEDVSETIPDEVPEGEPCPTCQQVHELMSPEEEALFAQLQKAQEQLALITRQRAYWHERAYVAEDKLAEAKPKCLTMLSPLQGRVSLAPVVDLSWATLGHGNCNCLGPLVMYECTGDKFTIRPSFGPS